MNSKEQLSRRKFLCKAGLIAAGTVTGTAAAAVSSLTNKQPEKASKKVSKKVKPKAPAYKPALRKLGKSDLMISDIALGTGSELTPALIKYAVKNGITFIHTSIRYAGGKSIKTVAQAIKGIRDKVVLGLKITWDPDDDKAMDSALKTLGVDSVDIAFFNIHNADEVKKEKYRKGAEKWKKAGKFKYIGLTTHSEVKECMEIALKQRFYDALMPSYNLGMEKECAPVLAQAEKQGLGVVLMKTKRGMNNWVYLKSIPKYLATPGVTTICKGLKSFAAIDEIISASEAKLSKYEERVLDENVRLGLIGKCMMCGACSNACPKNVPVADMMRCADYYLSDPEYYEIAKSTYATISNAECVNCGECERICPNDVPIRHNKMKLEKMVV